MIHGRDDFPGGPPRPPGIRTPEERRALVAGWKARVEAEAAAERDLLAAFDGDATPYPPPGMDRTTGPDPLDV